MKSKIIVLSVLSSLMIGCVVKHEQPDMNKTYDANESLLLASKQLPTALLHGIDISSSGLSLQEAIEIAQFYSLRTVSANSKLTEADARIQEIEAGYYPKVNVLAKTRDYSFDRMNSISRSNDEYAQAQVSLQYNLLDFGRTRYGVDSATQLRESAKYIAEYEENKVSFNVIKAYFNIRRYTQQKSYAQDYIKEMSDLVKTIGVRVNGGLSPQSEAIRAQLALTNAQNAAKSIELQLKKSTQELNTLLGRSVPTKSLKLKEAFISSEELQEILESVLVNNPDIKASESQLNSARSEVEVAKSARYPTVDAVGSYTKPFQHPDDKDGNFIGGKVSLQVSMPILDGGINTSRIGQATARHTYSMASYNQLVRDVKEISNNLVEDALNAADTFRIQYKAEQDASKTRKLYMDEFRLGQRNLNDLLTVETDYFSAKVSKLSALYDYYLSTLGLYLLADQLEVGMSRLNLN
ncbi:hypothetical protein A9G34_03760 [Gilliamella sp. Choc4-2]|uniref:TolC family protein n=1 Tax=unclassified Gilliamella TaxID=2685620 RepID=UPI0004DCF2B3|nr:TolC family protein [Gilliamella apicola]KFA59289.1 Type I secretion system, outer membrane component LapE/AggA [Gilliamella apicola]OCG32578.1 hypothetical protein A9G33_03065 [Gilliamella apicola]OCG46863.1 hypothetical protein A9G34_03760 [Gilliamella apicola]OCG53697.1 hypothetical protein A9G36_09290 [Gilliamella apicola]OCG64244.1 hypothetical protein A9G48_03145 [Gilliamella apicola]